MTDNNGNITCQFCNKIFSTKYNLIKHQKSTKYCLELQNVNIDFISCNYCNKNFSRKDTLENHLLVCKHTDVKFGKRDVINYKEIIEDQNKLLDKYKLEIIELGNKNKELEKYLVYVNLYEDERNKNKQLENTLENLASKAIEKAGNKTTNNIINNNKNKIIQSLKPLTEQHMKEQTKFLTYQNVKNGIDGIASFASNFTYKDRLYCSDVSRLSFIFKNEDDDIIKDPEGIEITNKFIEINREELLRLLEEYFLFIVEKLDKDCDTIEYKYWASRREEVIATRSAIKNGNGESNKEYYSQFRKSFLSALSELVKR